MKNKSFGKGKSFIIILIVFSLLIGSISGIISLIRNNTQNNEYMKIGEKSFSLQEYEVFYVLYINEFVNSYALYLDELGLDVNKDFAKQNHDDNTTWEEYFKEQTEKQMKQFVALNEDAKETNTALNTTSQVDELIDIFKQNAEYQDSTFEQYIKDLFGQDVTEKDVRSAVEYKYNAVDYSNILEDKLSNDITEKDLISLYTEYPETFDKVIYRAIEFDSEEEASNFKDTINNEDDFIEKSKEFTEEDTLKEDIGTSTIDNEELIEFLYNKERKPGDIEIIASEDKYAVIFFKSRSICNDKTVDFRHIYFNTQGASSEEKEEIKEKAEEVFNTFKNSDKTVETFESYAFIYSDDSTTSQNGGLVTGIRQGSVEEDLNNWLFDEQRKAGDYTLAETSIGYHIVYYVSKNEEYWKVLAKQYLVENAYNSYVESLLDKFEE